MTVKIIHSKALSKYYKRSFSDNAIETYDNFYKKEGEKLAAYIKDNFTVSTDVSKYNILCIELGYKPWELLAQPNYTNFQITVYLFKDEENFNKYLEILEKTAKKYKDFENDLDTAIHFNDRSLVSYKKIYSFSTIPMFNNCGALVSTHAQKFYRDIKRISGPMLQFKKNIAQFHGFSLLMMTVIEGKYSKILKNLGMEEVHSFKNRRSYNNVLTLVTPIEKLENDK